MLKNAPFVGNRTQKVQRKSRQECHGIIPANSLLLVSVNRYFNV